MKQDPFETKPLGECLAMLEKHPELQTPKNISVFLKRLRDDKPFLTSEAYPCHNMIKQFLTNCSGDDARANLETIITLGFWGGFGYNPFDRIIYQTISKHFVSGTPEQSIMGKKLLVAYVKNGALDPYSFASDKAHCGGINFTEDDISALLTMGMHAEILALVSHQKLRLTERHRDHAAALNQHLPIIWHAAFREKNHNDRPNIFKERRKRFEHLWQHAPWIFTKADAIKIASFSKSLATDIAQNAAGLISQNTLQQGFKNPNDLVLYEGPTTRRNTINLARQFGWQASPETIAIIRAWCFKFIANDTEPLDQKKTISDGFGSDPGTCQRLLAKYRIAPNADELLSLLGACNFSHRRKAIEEVWLGILTKYPIMLASVEWRSKWNETQQQAFFRLILEKQLLPELLNKEERPAFTRFLKAYAKKNGQEYEKISAALRKTRTNDAKLQQLLKFNALFKKSSRTKISQEFMKFALGYEKHADWFDFYQNLLRSPIGFDAAFCRKLMQQYAKHDDHPVLLRIAIAKLENGWETKPGASKEIMDFMTTFKRPGDWITVYTVFKPLIAYRDFLTNKETRNILEWFLGNAVLAMNTELEQLLIQHSNANQLANLAWRSPALRNAYEAKKLENFISA